MKRRRRSAETNPELKGIPLIFMTMVLRFVSKKMKPNCSLLSFINYSYCCIFAVFRDAGDDAPSQRDLTCVGASVTAKGRYNKFNAPSARKLQTNQHVESFQPPFLHKEAIFLLKLYTKHKGTFETRRSYQKKEHKVYIRQQNFERKDINRPAQTTKTCHASFPLVAHPSPLLSRPVHGDKRALMPRQHASR